jgi:hypothetical protein
MEKDKRTKLLRRARSSICVVSDLILAFNHVHICYTLKFEFKEHLNFFNLINKFKCCIHDVLYFFFFISSLEIRFQIICILIRSNFI